MCIGALLPSYHAVLRCANALLCLPPPPLLLLLLPLWPALAPLVISVLMLHLYSHVVAVLAKLCLRQSVVSLSGRIVFFAPFHTVGQVFSIARAHFVGCDAPALMNQLLGA